MALGRVRHLFGLARRRLREDDPASATRSVGLARRIAMRYQTGLPKDLRGRVCRPCGAALVPGRTARVRVRSGMVRTTCLGCGNTQRRPYVAEQKARRRTQLGIDADARPDDSHAARPTPETPVLETTP